jgi:DNA helicase HerA-like ATPase
MSDRQLTQKELKLMTVGDKPLGRFAATMQQPATPSTFHCWLSTDENQLQVGNFVVLVSQGDLAVGVIQDMKLISDFSDMLSAKMSSGFGKPDQESLTPFPTAMCCEVGVLRSWRELERPFSDGQVYLASAVAVDFALNVREPDNLDTDVRPGLIPIGLVENTEAVSVPIYIDETRLLGPLGAHINVTGMSGEAAKTSYIQYLLKAIFTHARTPVAAVVFNNKHADLLALDWENPEITKSDRDFYKKMGVPCEPFHKVRYFAPRNGLSTRALTKRRNKAGKNDANWFSWELDDILDFERPMSSPLLELLDESCRDDRALPAVLDLIDEMNPKNLAGRLAGIKQFSQLKDTLADWEEFHPHAKPTFLKVKRRINSLPQLYSGVVGTGVTQDIPFNSIRNGEIFVIDTASLSATDDRLQRFILSYTIKKLSQVVAANRKNPSSGSPQSVIVFIDELNKHCPATGDDSPLKTQIIELYSRGRSAGLVAAGAEQLLSRVEPQVVANNSTIVYGRTDNAELRDSIYGEFPDAYRERLRRMRQGQKMVKHTRFTQPVFITTARPPCASGDSISFPQQDEADELPIDADLSSLRESKGNLLDMVGYTNR